MAKGLSDRIRHPEVPPTLRKEDSKPPTRQKEVRRCAAQGSCLICVLTQGLTKVSQKSADPGVWDRMATLGLVLIPQNQG